MNIEVSDITGFIKVTADEDKVLTFYKDGDPIEDYTGFKIVHTNKQETITELREITVEQHRAYEEEKEHALHPDDETESENPEEETE